ncbi:DUF456 domain-containing protein [Candidatus Woesearchaeota archaeon]|nr:DUF456 domain-containing protein [Candidatus Woesearchaeota archaeon]
MILEWTAFIILFILALAGTGLTIVGIGGTFLILLGAVLYDLITWSTTISINTLLILAGLAIAGEALEWIVTIIGAKTAGVSRHSLIGTVIGAVIGGMLLSIIPIIGTIIGILAGAITGAFLMELYHTTNVHKAWKAAKGAFFGRLLVSLTKFLLAIIQIWIVLRAITA